MVTTAISSQPSLVPPKRHFWITDAALSNWREKVKNFATMGDEKLSLLIDEQVSKAINAGKFEKIMDVEEEARLIHLTEGTEPFFALVKKSANPANGDFAVVTIMTPYQVDKKRGTTWSRPPHFELAQDVKKTLASVKPSEVQPVERKMIQSAERQPVGGERPDSYLLSYMPFRPNAEVNKRVYEEWVTRREIESRIDEIKIVPGTMRVYKQLGIGYRIIDE